MTPTKPRFTAALLLLTSAAALCGCGPLRSTAFILDAEVQTEAAKTAGAEEYFKVVAACVSEPSGPSCGTTADGRRAGAPAPEYAPAAYQYTLATLYLKKAREVVGFSDYEMGVGFAEKASASARAAKDAAASKGEGSPSFNIAPTPGEIAPPGNPQQ